MVSRVMTSRASKVLLAVQQPDPVRERAARSNLHNALFAVLVSVGYFAGAKLGFALTASRQPISTFWPPNAILLAAFMLAPVRIWWILLLAALPAHLISELDKGVPLSTAIGWFVSNAGEGMIGAACILRFRKKETVFNSVSGLMIFIAFGVVFAPLLTSFVDAESVVITGWAKDYWALWSTRLLSNMLAGLTLVPVILLWGLNGASWIRKATWKRFLEAGLLAIGILIVSLVVFGFASSSPTRIPVLVYAPLPLLVWASLRFGTGGMSLSLLTVALISIWDAIHGYGPFTSASMKENVLSLQILLCMVSLPLMFLTAVIEEWRRAEESLRQVSCKLIDAQELERQSIARELHDEIGQQLAMVKIKLDQLPDEPDSSRSQGITAIQEKISEVASAVHEISHGLHPSHLDYLGLGRAIDRLCHDVESGSSLRIHLKVDPSLKRPAAEVSLCLYRVTQEALHNVVKHSAAQKVEISLTESHGRLTLRIEDDGVGFIADASEGIGLGLISMRERLRSVGGSIEVMSQPSRGTRVKVSVPVTPAGGTT